MPTGQSVSFKLGVGLQARPQQFPGELTRVGSTKLELEVRRRRREQMNWALEKSGWPPNFLPTVQGSSHPSRKSKKNPDVAKRRAFIRRIGQVSEEKYCAKMDAGGYVTPVTWQNWDCPNSYKDAWELTNNDLRDRFLGVMRSERQNARRSNSQ